MAKVFFGFKVDADIKKHIEDIAWLRRKPLSGIMEEIAKEWVKKNPLSDEERLQALSSRLASAFPDTENQRTLEKELKELQSKISKKKPK